jgi:hypothetical protein
MSLVWVRSSKLAHFAHTIWPTSMTPDARRCWTGSATRPTSSRPGPMLVAVREGAKMAGPQGPLCHWLLEWKHHQAGWLARQRLDHTRATAARKSPKANRAAPLRGASQNGPNFRCHRQTESFRFRRPLERSNNGWAGVPGRAVQ